MRTLRVLLCAAVTALPAAAAAAPPDWVREAARRTPAVDGAAIVLLDQVDVTVTSDGRSRSTRRYVVRIKDKRAAGAAGIRDVYLTDAGRVREIRGWILRATGESRDLGGRDVLDVAVVNNDVFNEVRVKVLEASGDVEPGDVFAAESVSEDRLLFAQLEWALQERWPVAQVRRSITLPDGWRATAVTFNSGPIKDQRVGATTSWELRDLPGIPEEPGMPPATDLVPRLAVSLFGPNPSPGQFETWRDVSRWLYSLSPSSVPAETVAARARQLTAGASSPFTRAAALARYVQRVQYVSIQTGVGRGGGYRPRPAALVLERNYGDCKDKANLLREMLAAVGISSHLVSIYAGDRAYVRPEWPTPQQFNHAIIAIALPDIPEETVTIAHPTLGRLALFDPTDEHTPLGQLPLHEQGSHALVIAEEGGDLIRVPAFNAERNRVVRTVEGEVAADGTLTGRVTERYHGAAASDARAIRRTLDSSAYAAHVSGRLASTVPRVRIESLEGTDDASGDGFGVGFRISSPGFVQRQGALVLLRTPFTGAAVPHLPASKRQTTLRLEPELTTEDLRLRLPSGVVVEELPGPVELQTDFGRYSLAYTAEGSTLAVKRRLEVQLQAVPPARYGDARAFFEAIRAADAAPVVLVTRKP